MLTTFITGGQDLDNVTEPRSATKGLSIVVARLTISLGIINGDDETYKWYAISECIYKIVNTYNLSRQARKEKEFGLLKKFSHNTHAQNQHIVSLDRLSSSAQSYKTKLE